MRAFLLVTLLAAAAAAQQLPVLKKIYPPPEQPIPFSHKTHAAQGLECAKCHPIPDPGDFAEIAETSTCMGCHSAVKTDSPHIRKLAAADSRGEPIDWTPVYMLQDYVFFSHREHIERARASCVDCHGEVAARDALSRERDISMAACMECHRAKSASNECDFCHEAR